MLNAVLNQSKMESKSNMRILCFVCHWQNVTLKHQQQQQKEKYLTQSQRTPLPLCLPGILSVWRSIHLSPQNKYQNDSKVLAYVGTGTATQYCHQGSCELVIIRTPTKNSTKNEEEEEHATTTCLFVMHSPWLLLHSFVKMENIWQPWQTKNKSKLVWYSPRLVLSNKLASKLLKVAINRN